MSSLCDLIFLVKTENKLPSFKKVSCGVSQGSILTPFRFLTYNMPQEVKSNLLFYADDSGLMYQYKDISKIEKILNKDFEYICDWFVDNK